MKPLTWEENVRILSLTACAVLYLHPPMCASRYIKSYVSISAWFANIWLMPFLLCMYRRNISSLRPYLGDFGFLVALPVEHKSSGYINRLVLAGTREYLAPEFITGKIGPMVDVYSYGVVSIIKTCTMTCLHVCEGVPRDFHWTACLFQRAGGRTCMCSTLSCSTDWPLWGQNKVSREFGWISRQLSCHTIWKCGGHILRCHQGLYSEKLQEELPDGWGSWLVQCSMSQCS